MLETECCKPPDSFLFFPAVFYLTLGHISIQLVTRRSSYLFAVHFNCADAISLRINPVVISLRLPQLGLHEFDLDSIHLDTKETAKGQKDTRPVPRFKPGIGYAAEQIKLLVSIAGKYHFTTQQQYVALLRDMGVKVEFVEPKLGKPKTYYYGIDPKRNCVCTVKMEGKKIGAPSRDELDAYMSQCKAENRNNCLWKE